MTLSHEDTLKPSADDDPSCGGLALDNFVTRLNQLAEILGDQPVLTEEIKERLGRDARYWASRGVDLSVAPDAGEDPDSSSGTVAHLRKRSVALRDLTLRNLATLYWDYTKNDEDIPDLPPDIRNNMGQIALFLAEQGVDLSDSPETDEDGMTD
jgi:hypothetical protein